jgi:hypothetical protein
VDLHTDLLERLDALSMDQVFFSLVQEDQFCTGHLGTSGLGPGFVSSL